MNSNKEKLWGVIDLVFAVIHYVFALIIIILSFSFNIYTGIAIGFLSILFVGMFFTYFIRNLFYVYFCYGLLICASVLIMPYLFTYLFTFFTEVFIFTLLPGHSSYILFLIPLLIELWYTYHLLRSHGLSSIAKKVFIRRFGGFYSYGGKKIDSFWQDKDPEKKVEEKKARKKFEIKYKMYMIIIITVICIIGFLSMLMVSAYV